MHALSVTLEILKKDVYLGNQQVAWRPSASHKCRVRRRLRCLQLATASKQPGADSQLPPWLLGFQCNERYLKWGDSAQTQLLKIYAARELGKVLEILPPDGLLSDLAHCCLEKRNSPETASISLMPIYALQDVPWVEEQLRFLSDTLPDLVNKLSRMKAGLLLALVKDTQVFTPFSIQRAGCNPCPKAWKSGYKSSIATCRCALGVHASLYDMLQAVADKMVRLKALLPSIDISLLVAGCPSLLVTHDIQTLEKHLTRLR